MNRRIKTSAASLKPGKAYVAACMGEDYIIAYRKFETTLFTYIGVEYVD